MLIWDSAAKAADGDQQDRGGPTRQEGDTPAIIGEDLSKPTVTVATVVKARATGRPMSAPQADDGRPPRLQRLLDAAVAEAPVSAATVATGWPEALGPEKGAAIRGPASRPVGSSASAMTKTRRRNIMASPNHSNAEI